MSKKCDELRQLFLLQQQSNNNNNHGGGSGDEGAPTSPTSSSPPTSSTTAFLRSLRKLPSSVSTSNGGPHGLSKPELDEDSNSSSLIANNSGEMSEESSINLCFSKEIESLKQNLKTQVSLFFELIRQHRLG